MLPHSLRSCCLTLITPFTFIALDRTLRSLHYLHSLRSLSLSLFFFACCSYSDMAVELERGLDVKDLTYFGTTHKRVFSGSDFVTWVVDKYSLQSRAEGVQVGQSLVASGFFAHVANDHNLEDNSKLFYRLQSDEDKFTLNLRRKWIDRVDKPNITVRNCKALFSAIEDKYGGDEGMVDFIAIGEDPQWPEFEDATCEFQQVGRTHTHTHTHTHSTRTHPRIHVCAQQYPATFA
jgi:hypothetical protein